MASYAVEVLNHTNTAGLTNAMLTLLGSTVRRLKMYEFVIGSRADGGNAANYRLARLTNAFSQTTALVEAPLDPADVAAGGTAFTQPYTSTAPTVGNGLKPVSLNQRSTFRHICSPGREYISAAVADSGFVFWTNAVAAAAFVVDFNSEWEE